MCNACRKKQHSARQSLLDEQWKEEVKLAKLQGCLLYQSVDEQEVEERQAASLLKSRGVIVAEEFKDHLVVGRSKGRSKRVALTVSDVSSQWQQRAQEILLSPQCGMPKDLASLISSYLPSPRFWLEISEKENPNEARRMMSTRPPSWAFYFQGTVSLLPVSPEDGVFADGATRFTLDPSFFPKKNVKKSASPMDLKTEKEDESASALRAVTALILHPQWMRSVASGTGATEKHHAQSFRWGVSGLAFDGNNASNNAGGSIQPPSSANRTFCLVLPAFGRFGAYDCVLIAAEGKELPVVNTRLEFLRALDD